MALSSKQTEHATVAIYTGGGRNSISIARHRHLHNNNSSPDYNIILLLLYYSQLLSYLRTQFSGPDEIMYSIQFYYFPSDPELYSIRLCVQSFSNVNFLFLPSASSCIEI